MADPITWGLINLVKKGIKSVQTTLDGVSDKVSGLPDSLDADFTEVKNAISEVKTDVGNVKNDTELNIPGKIDSESQEIKEEIHKILFNLPRNVKDGTFRQFYRNRGSQPYNTQYTALSVTGKGYLYYAGLAETISNQNIYVEVILDGKTFKINQDNKGRFTGFISKESIFTNSFYDTTTEPFVNLIGASSGADGSATPFFVGNSDINFLTNIMLSGEEIGKGTCMSEYALKFNNSLTVKLMNGGYGIALYELIE